MTHEVAAHRLGFPITRKIAQKVAIVGAMVANRWSTEYLGKLSEVEYVEEDWSPGGYL